MKMRKSLWPVLCVVAVLCNLYILFEYFIADVDISVLLYSIRFIMNVIAVSISFWRWSSPKRLYAALPVALYTFGVFSNLVAMLRYQYFHPPFFRWDVDIMIGLFVIALCLLTQCFFVIAKASPNASWISLKLILSAVSIAASFILDFTLRRASLSDIIFPTLLIAAATMPAIILAGHTARFHNALEEEQLVRQIEKAEEEGEGVKV